MKAIGGQTHQKIKQIFIVTVGKQIRYSAQARLYDLAGAAIWEQVRVSLNNNLYYRIHIQVQGQAH